MFIKYKGGSINLSRTFTNCYKTDFFMDVEYEGIELRRYKSVSKSIFFIRSEKEFADKMNLKVKEAIREGKYFINQVIEGKNYEK